MIKPPTTAEINAVMAVFRTTPFRIRRVACLLYYVSSTYDLLIYHVDTVQLPFTSLADQSPGDSVTLGPVGVDGAGDAAGLGGVA